MLFQLLEIKGKISERMYFSAYSLTLNKLFTIAADLAPLNTPIRHRLETFGNFFFKWLKGGYRIFLS